MRYVNLVPEVSKKPLKYESEQDKYKRYILSNTEYRNRPDRKEFMKNYYAEYRKEYEGQVQCDCGSIVKQLSMYAHIKSNKHLAYLTK